MKLAVISHTPHYWQAGQIVGWEPTVRELNHLLELFDEIWHIAVLMEGEAPKSCRAYASARIHFVPIKPFGGEGVFDKLGVLLQMPAVLYTVTKTLRLVDCFQLRAPMGIGNYLIPYLAFCSNKAGWFKYAGNWVQENAPMGYRWQRWWLQHGQSRKVTLNGQWPKQASHLLTFENPCLSDDELKAAAARSIQKKFEDQWILCFVGSLTPNKGGRQVLEALCQMPAPPFAEILIAGDGPERLQLEALAKTASIPVRLLGFLSRQQLNEVYSRAHFLILPSENEGFPKVIAEACAHGCIPIVSNVSCLSQYIRESYNGFLLADNSTEAVLKKMESIQQSDDHFQAISERASVLAEAFTFERYIHRIHELILNGTPPHSGNQIAQPSSPASRTH